MNQSKKAQAASAVREAIRDKRERKAVAAADIEALEASLLADIETFDLDAAERRARLEASVNVIAGMVDAGIEFPEIVPVLPPCLPKPVPETVIAGSERAVLVNESASLIEQLRQRVAIQRHVENVSQAERSASNKQIDETLKYIFFYLHDLVQQLNILKLAIPRSYPLAEKFELNNLVWQEGFADYRTQAQSAGALLELVSLAYQLRAPDFLTVERGGEVAERFRSMLFDFGLQFSVREFKNGRHYVERAEFDIQRHLSVSIRWRADFERGLLVFEARNLERLGTFSLDVRPAVIDFALLEELGKLLLGQPSRFRELAKR